MLMACMLVVMRNDHHHARAPRGFYSITGHWALVKSVGERYRAETAAPTHAAHQFIHDVVDAIDALGNVRIAAEQDAHDQWDAEAREIEAAFKGEIPMPTYRVEVLIAEREDGSQEWAVAARWPADGEPRQMGYGPASGLTREQAEHTARMLNAAASGVSEGMARIVEETP